MAKRSLQASPLGQEKARKALKRTGWTQEYLASEIGISTRQPIWKFLKGKGVDRHLFMEICFKLDLDWEEIAVPLNDEAVELDALIEQVRSQRYEKIESQCATMRLLDVPQPVNIDSIYINVNILDRPCRHRWLDIAALEQCHPDDFDRFGLGRIVQEKIPGLEAIANHSKLMVLGKPGSGKTTFLQKIALLCNQGKIQPHHIPIFIRLKNFTADLNSQDYSSLTDYIRQELTVSNLSAEDIETLLDSGKVLILLDGLDEVKEDESYELLKQIRQLCEKFYKNNFVITCRIATQQYQLEGFTEIELADFDLPEIQAFVRKWFLAVSNNEQEALAKAELFLEKLQMPENLQIRELAVTPILLNLTCSVFQVKKDFPLKRSELYKKGLEILLMRWDESRGVKRDSSYRNLSFIQKIKLLTQVASETFEKGYYFLEQGALEAYIINFLKDLPNTSQDADFLEIESQAVLKDIELQHGLLVERARGVYSFSHLTFQEYLTARNLVSNTEPTILKQNLQHLASHVADFRWREVFLLALELLSHPEELLLLMKQQVDRIVAEDEKLQNFLIWLSQKSASVKAPYQSAAIRAFYLTLTLTRELNLQQELNLALTLDYSLAGNLAPELNCDLALERSLTMGLALPEKPSLERLFALGLALPSQCLGERPQLYQSLSALKEKLPNFDQGAESIATWWEKNRHSWIAELREIARCDRNIGQDWQFTQKQKATLQRYFKANQFLLECLNSNYPVTPEVRSQIHETLLSIDS